MKCSEISLSVIMPFYNEKDNIISAIEHTIIKFKYFKKAELIIVNYCSNDDINKKFIDLSIKYPNLIILKYNQNKNILNSIKYKILNDYILFNSMDLILDTKDICNIIEQTFPFDLLVLERKEYSLNWNSLVSFFNRIILHIFFPLALIDIADCNYTFIIKKDILNKVFPISVSSNFFNVEIILRAKYLKFDVKTIEIKYNGNKFSRRYFERLKNIIYYLKDIFVFRIYSLLLILGIKK